MTRGITGSGDSLRTTVSGAASVADEVTAGEASIPLVTTDIFPVPTEDRGEVVTSRNGDPVVDWALEVVGRWLDVHGVGVFILSVVVTLVGTATITLLVVVVVASVTVATVAGFGLTGLVV